jgi:hypothetical protein
VLDAIYFSIRHAWTGLTVPALKYRRTVEVLLNGGWEPVGISCLRRELHLQQWELHLSLKWKRFASLNRAGCNCSN